MSNITTNRAINYTNLVQIMIIVNIIIIIVVIIVMRPIPYEGHVNILFREPFFRPTRFVTIVTSFPSWLFTSNSPSKTDMSYGTRSWKQWAAETTHFGSIKEPPQKIPLRP